MHNQAGQRGSIMGGGPVMGWSWLWWLGGGVVLAAAGFGAAVLPGRRAYDHGRRITWSTARAAIDAAEISRDAAPRPVAEAEQLLARAQALAADRGGRTAARAATDYARRADRLWRATAGPQARP
ncbi:DUF6403 family protein [Solwaraspora sp. WMMD791]|uniref:DUF6403 family protein n=1 Tax=Solwaraspora sp. WMMD791 TaxID=3016086 RepID=UPI00249CB0A0|nr:DUF6403 family protein [Solwaraspora sp. WMMD791]WFE29615.1 DUF6403 family protein [Solwaraspora sp. WMMD791]